MSILILSFASGPAHDGGTLYLVEARTALIALRAVTGWQGFHSFASSPRGSIETSFQSAL